MNYSFNRNKEGLVFGSAKDLNASHKDLCAVGDAIRYKRVSEAMKVLDGVITGGRPILYVRHNKYMGSRHELGGKKGKFPIKCAGMVKKVLINAAANATTRGLDADSMYVIHYSANKTTIVRRGPSKGTAFYGRGMYGRGSYRRSDLELAKIEIGLSQDLTPMSTNVQNLVKRTEKSAPKKQDTAKKEKVAIKAKA